MKLLVVGHMYLNAFNQRKYAEMKRQCASLQLRILTPRSMPHVFRRYIREIRPELTRDEVVDIREFVGRSHMSYVLNPIHFARILREFKPDHIHIEEDPYSAVGVEAVTLARVFCRKAKISFFIWDNLARKPRFPLNAIKDLLNQYSLSRAGLVVCGNREGERLLRSKKGFLGRTAILPQMGVDDSDYAGGVNSDLRDELGVADDVPLIGYIGRLIPEKGVALLLQALDALKDIPWKALFLGAGPLAAELAGHWKMQLGDRLIVRDAVPHKDVPSYMRALDMLVLPSYSTTTWKEQFGMVLAQAMMAGVPCIGSTSGAIPDVIGPGGIVFKEKDVDDLASAIRKLAGDEAQRRMLGRMASEFAKEHYTDTVVAKSYLNAFGWDRCVPQRTACGTE